MAHNRYRFFEEVGVLNKKILFMLLLVLFVCGCQGQTKESLYEEGVKQSEARNYQGAIVLFKNSLEKDPNFFEARYYLGDAYLHTGKFEKAEKEFLKVLKQGGNFPALPLRLGEVYLYTERPDLTIKEVKRFLTSNAGTWEAYNLLGQAFAVKKDFPTAEKHFRTALDLEKSNPQAGINLVRVLLAQKRTTEARQNLIEITKAHENNTIAWHMLAKLEAAGGNIDGALKAYEKISEIDSSDTSALYMKGRILLSQGKIEEGSEIADDLIARFPKSAQGPLLKGLSLYLQKNYDDAIVQCQKSLSISPDLMGYYFLGLSYYNTEKFELALNQFQKILDSAPDFLQPRVMVAMIFLKQKRFDDAITECTKMLKKHPSNGLVHNILGSAYMGQGEMEKSVEEFDKAVDLDPRLADAHFKKGLFSIKAGNMEEAEDQLETAVSLAPEALNSRIVLASHYLRQEDYAKAIETLEKGLSGQIQDAVLYNYLSLAYFSQKDPEKALASLENAKKAKPDFLPPYFNLASYYGKKGELEKAREQYLAVLAKDPANLRALIGMAVTSEMQQKDTEALTYFQKAKETNNTLGFMALIGYYNKKNQPEKAMEVLEESLKVDPQNVAFLNLQGQLLLKKKDYKAAEATFKTLESIKPGKGYPTLIKIYQLQGENQKAETLANNVIRSAPNSPYGFLLLASVYEQQKNLQAALSVLGKGLESNEGNPSLLMGIGSIYSKLNKPDSALKIYKGLLEKKPDFYPAIYAIGTIYDKNGEKKKSLEYYEQVLKKNRNHTPTLNNLAYLKAVNYGDLETAVEFAMRAYRNEPSNPYILDTLGYVLLKQGKLKEASSLLEKASSLLPSSSSIKYHLALAAFNAGDKKKSEEYLLHVLSGADFPEKEEAKDLLKRIKE